MPNIPGSSIVRRRRSHVAFGLAAGLAPLLATACDRDAAAEPAADPVVAATSAAPTTPPPAPAPIGGRSGLDWPSGAYVPGGARDGYDTFASWRGRPLDVITVWTDRGDWNDIIGSWIYREWQARPEILSIGIPPYPEEVGGSLDACANGDYDDEWRRVASAMRDAGIAHRTIVRLGWEFNGDWYAWAAHDPRAFAGCWRHVVGAADEVAPELRWEWTVAAGPGPAVRDPAEAWPGREWVDVVGVTKYDEWPQACTDDVWADHHVAGEFELDHWRTFAVEAGLPIAVSEWAAFDRGDNAGSPCPDNAAYIEHMHDWFGANADLLAYEAYFNIDADDMLSSLHTSEGLPAAGENYLDRFGSR